MNSYTDFYARQAQSGVGSLYHPGQKGRGLGNFFGSIFRSVYPYIKSGFSALTGELLKGGVGLLEDTVRQVPIKESITNRVQTFGKNLTDRAVKTMTGSGLRKRKRKASAAQSAVSRRRRKTKKRKVQRKRKPVKRLVHKKKKKNTARTTCRKKKGVCKKKRTATNSFKDIFS